MGQGKALLPRGLLAGGLSILCVCPAAGQVYRPTAADIAAGDSVRIDAGGASRVEATVIRWQGPTLLLSVPGLSGPWHLPVDQIAAMDRYQAIHARDGFRRGVAVGIAAGVFIGAAVGLGLYATGVTKDEDGPPGEQLMASVLKYSGLFTVGGALAWGFVKAQNPGHGWVAVSFNTP